MTTLTMPPSTLGAGYKMTIERIFEAPPELVFDCFTDPEHFARWWGPLGCRSTIYTLDARPGGEISLRMAGPGYDHVMGGEFVEVDRPRKLVFLAKAFKGEDGDWQLIHRTTLIFAPLDGATRMTLHSVVLRAEGAMVSGALGGMKAGWGQSLERLGDLVGGGGKTDIEVGDKRITLTRAFDAPRERLWAFLTEPDLMMRWWIAGEGQVEVMDVRPGGQWRVRTKHGDGQDHLFWGRFLEIEASERLVMTQGFDDHADVPVETVLTQQWGRTVLVRTMTFPDNAYRDGMLGSGYARHSAASYDLLAEAVKG
jgi:uncharacterized protein YndB with AHSA1/START domain